MMVNLLLKLTHVLVCESKTKRWGPLELKSTGGHGSNVKWGTRVPHANAQSNTTLNKLLILVGSCRLSTLMNILMISVLKLAGLLPPTPDC